MVPGGSEIDGSREPWERLLGGDGHSARGGDERPWLGHPEWPRRRG
jgi:hypothetical protein